MLEPGKLCAGQQRRALTFNDLGLVLGQTPNTVANAQRLKNPGSPVDPSKANDGELLWINLSYRSAILAQREDVVQEEIASPSSRKSYNKQVAPDWQSLMSPGISILLESGRMSKISRAQKPRDGDGDVDILEGQC